MHNTSYILNHSFRELSASLPYSMGFSINGNLFAGGSSTRHSLFPYASAKIAVKKCAVRRQPIKFRFTIKRKKSPWWGSVYMKFEFTFTSTDHPNAMVQGDDVYIMLENRAAATYFKSVHKRMVGATTAESGVRMKHFWPKLNFIIFLTIIISLAHYSAL